MCVMENKRFVLDPSGTCAACTQKPPKTDVIICTTCKCVFHAICPTSKEHDFICRATFLKNWNSPSVKSNFKWYCDCCLTKHEEKAVSTMEERFDKLVDLVTELSAEVKSLKSSPNVLAARDQVSIESSAPVTPSSTVWSNEKRVKSIKASLVIKNKPGNTSTTDKDADLLKLKALAVSNKIPVSRVGFDSNGNTFVDCPSETDRNKLQPLLANDFADKDVSAVKEKLPCISIVGIEDEVTKSNLVTQLTKQNPKVDALVNAGEEFTVLFVKTTASGYTAVARVSPKIRTAIQSERDRVFLGVTCCKVYDRFHIKRCNNCQGYGHFKDSCNAAVCCAYCGLDHDSQQCGVKQDAAKHSCINCKNAGLANYTGHTTFSLKCPTYIAAQNRLKSTIPYYEPFMRKSHLNR